MQCAAQADTLDILMPELEELRKEVDRLQGVEAQYANIKRDLDAAKASLAESTQALVDWQAADKQHKELFGPLASLDPDAMASKLDDTLAELKLIRVRQEQVLEQQEKIRLNAEKAQLQKEMQEQKIKARQKANAEKAMQKYSANADIPVRQSKTPSPVSNAVKSPMPPVEAKPLPAAVKESNDKESNDQGPNDKGKAEPDMATEDFFANAGAQASVVLFFFMIRSVRRSTQSPISVDHMPKTPGQQLASAAGQAGSAVTEVTAQPVVRPHKSVASPAKLQSALQKTLAQLAK